MFGVPRQPQKSDINVHNACNEIQNVTFENGPWMGGSGEGNGQRELLI